MQFVIDRIERKASLAKATIDSGAYEHVMHRHDHGHGPSATAQTTDRSAPRTDQTQGPQ